MQRAGLFWRKLASKTGASIHLLKARWRTSVQMRMAKAMNRHCCEM